MSELTNEPDQEYQSRLNELSIKMHHHLLKVSDNPYNLEVTAQKHAVLATMYASAISALGVIHEEKLRERAADG